MPSPVAPWVQQQFLTPKSLNLALYTSDGTAGNTTGIAFGVWRPVLFEAYNTALTLRSSVAGTRSTLASSGAVTSCWVVLDTAGYFGQSQDLPAKGYYQLTPAVLGSTGDGKTAGGWYLLAHVAPLTSTATQTAVGADLMQNGAFLSAGSRQQPISGVHSAPIFVDLVNCGQNTLTPAVLVDDSSAANAAVVLNTTDSSGETPRFCAIWAGISATSTGFATFTKAGTYTWLAPAGVNQVTVTETGAGAGGGAGNSAVSSFGGGGGGGGQTVIGVVGVVGDGQHSYPVTVGAAGTGGAQPGANGSNGGVSTFTGLSSLTANGGQFGSGATTAANGALGLGGSGGTAPVRLSGGAGAAGVTNKSGGGGGSSGGTATGGNPASGATGAPAPPGGGPGGAGGAPLITIVQSKGASATGNNLTVTMPAAFQAGNAVLVLMYYQGTSPSGDPAVTLTDGTVLTSQVNADVTSNVSLQVRLFDVYAVTGGQTGVSITGHGSGSGRAVIAQVYEVAGLGANPVLDPSGGSSHTQGPTHPDMFYQSYSGSPPVTTKAPELWVGLVGAQYTQSFTIKNPGSAEGWTMDAPRYVSPGGIFGGILTAHQSKATTGTLAFAGTFSRGVTKGTLAAGYSTGAATVGQPPPAGPGGGGGGGFGQNPGANGADGQVTLTWTAAANANYGTPPVPVPQASWDETTPATAALVNGSTGIAGVLNFLANPPTFRAHATAAQSVANAPGSPVPLTLGVADTDTYSGWNSGTNTYTVQRNGIYLVGALVPFAANATGIRLAGVSVNGTTYWGPACNGFAADLCCATKTQVLSLNAGDTVQLVTYQNSGAALNTGTAAQARLFLVWLGAQGTPSPLPTAPDPGFRWQSGTPGPAVPGLMTQHLSQDLTFLVQRPYVLAYQATAQTGLANNAFSTVTLDTVAGIVHADAGDNYSGWTSGAANNYAAVTGAPGWYLVCGEFFTSSAAAGSSVVAAVLPSTSGGSAPATTPDWYQHLACTANATAGGGATVFGLYQLSVNESITPQVQGAAMGGTYSTLAAAGFGGKFNSHLAAIWISS